MNNIQKIEYLFQIKFNVSMMFFITIVILPVSGAFANADVIYGMEQVYDIAISSDGTKLLTAEAGDFVVMRNVNTGAVKQGFQHGDERSLKKFTSVAISPDGTKVVASSDNGITALWDAETGAWLHTLSDLSNYSVNCVAFSPNGSRVITGSSDTTVRRYDTNTGSVSSIIHNSTAITSVAYSPDGTKILTGAEGNSAKLWTSSGTLIHTFTAHTKSITSVAFSPGGGRILTGAKDSTAILWNADTGDFIRFFTGHMGAVTSVAFSPDGTKILTGSADNTAKLWNKSTGALLYTFTGHTNNVTSVAFSPDSTRAYTGSLDHTVRWWDTSSGLLISLYGGNQHTDEVTSVAISPNNTKVLTGSKDETAKLWEKSKGTLIRTFSGHNKAVTSVAFSPDDTQVLTGSEDNTAKLWNKSTGDLICTFTGHLNDVTSVAFSPDGTQVLTGSADKTAKLRNTSGGVIHTFSGHSDDVNAVAFSPNGAQILTGSADNTAKLWKISTGDEIRTFSGHTDGVLSVAFSPDSTKILTSGEDTTARLWDKSTGTVIRTFYHSGIYIHAAAFSPDNGDRILTGGGYEDAKAIVWNTDTRAKLRTFTGHWYVREDFDYQGNVLSVAFSPDGTQALTGSKDKRAMLWEAPPIPPLPPVPPRVTHKSPDDLYVYDATVDIAVTFSKEVTGVDATDMELGGSLTWGNAAANASVGTPTYLGDNTWLFPVSGLKSGSLAIELAPNVDDIEDLDGVDLDPRPTFWGYHVSMLQVLSAEARNNSTVRLIFNEILNDNAALVNPANYTFTGGGAPLTTDFVTRINNKTVDVTVNETITEAALYTVYVETGSSGPTTAGGLSIHVNPQYNSADFTGSEPPTVVSSSPVAWTTTYTSTMDIDVTFSKEVTGVDATDLKLSNLASADAIVGTPTDLGSDTWRFPVSGLTTGRLDISLAPDPDDIEDVDGKDLVPSPTTWTYVADVTRLNSATAISATVVHLSFNESPPVKV